MTTKVQRWGERLAACRASGLSTAAFCRANEVPYAQFMYWQRRLSNVRSGLVPMQVSTSSAAAMSVELALGDGITVRVRGITTPDVVALVRGLSC